MHHRRGVWAVCMAATLLMASSWAPVQAFASAPAPWRLLAGTTSSARFYAQAACSGSSRCWVPFSAPAGGGVGVLATVDGGASWAMEPLPGHAARLAAVSCTDLLDCWLVGYSGDLSTKSQGAAFRTVNGGRSWTSLRLPSALGMGPLHQLFGIACRGPDWCSAVGWGLAPSTSAKPAGCVAGCSAGARLPGGRLLAVTTADGGGTWKVAAIPLVSGAQVNAISCGAVGACQAVGFGFTDCRSSGKGPGGGVICGPAGAAARSGAGGSWVSGRIGPGIFNLYGVSCPAAAQCWATGSTGNDVQGRGVVLHTTDGGATWARQAPVPGSNSLTSISCPNVQYCTAVGGLGTAANVTPVVEVSRDGGAAWSTEPLPPGLSQVLSVTCPTPAQCIATAIEGYGPSEKGVLLAS